MSSSGLKRLPATCGKLKNDELVDVNHLGLKTNSELKARVKSLEGMCRTYESQIRKELPVCNNPETNETSSHRVTENTAEIQKLTAEIHKMQVLLEAERHVVRPAKL